MSRNKHNQKKIKRTCNARGRKHWKQSTRVSPSLSNKKGKNHHNSNGAKSKHNTQPPALKDDVPNSPDNSNNNAPSATSNVPDFGAKEMEPPMTQRHSKLHGHQRFSPHQNTSSSWSPFHSLVLTVNKTLIFSLMARLSLRQAPGLGVQDSYSGLNLPNLWELQFKEEESLLEEALFGGKTPVR